MCSLPPIDKNVPLTSYTSVREVDHSRSAVLVHLRAAAGEPEMSLVHYTRHATVWSLSTSLEYVWPRLLACVAFSSERIINLAIYLDSQLRLEPRETTTCAAFPRTTLRPSAPAPSSLQGSLARVPDASMKSQGRRWYVHLLINDVSTCLLYSLPSHFARSM